MFHGALFTSDTLRAPLWNHVALFGALLTLSDALLPFGLRGRFDSFPADRRLLPDAWLHLTFVSTERFVVCSQFFPKLLQGVLYLNPERVRYPGGIFLCPPPSFLFWFNFICKALIENNLLFNSTYFYYTCTLINANYIIIICPI